MHIIEYYSWLKKEWAKVGFIVSIFLFVFLFVIVRKYDFVLFIILLQTPLYMIHETEEYIFPGGFAKFFNRRIYKVEYDDRPMDENFVFFVNIILVWLLYPICGLLSTINYSFGLWLPYFTFIAGVVHIPLSIKAKQVYNPGLIVSLFINIPFGIWSVVSLVNLGVLKSYLWNPYIVIAILVQLTLPLAGRISYKVFCKNNNRI